MIGKRFLPLPSFLPIIILLYVANIKCYFLKKKGTKAEYFYLDSYFISFNVQKTGLGTIYFHIANIICTFQVPQTIPEPVHMYLLLFDNYLQLLHTLPLDLQSFHHSNKYLSYFQYYL